MPSRGAASRATGFALPRQRRTQKRLVVAASTVALLAAVATLSRRSNVEVGGQCCPPPAPSGGGSCCPPPGSGSGAGSTGTQERGEMKGPRFDVDFLGETAVPLVFWNTGSCPFAQRAWIALEEKQVPYEFRKVDLSAKPSDFVAAYRSVNSNPNAKPKVPIVRTADNYTMIESDVVAEYLSERFPNRGSQLMPALPEQRAHVRLLAAVFDQTIGSSGFAYLHTSGREELTKQRNVLQNHLQVLNTFLERHGSGEGPFLCGANFSLAEVHAAPNLQRLSVLLPRLSKLNVLGLCKKLRLHRLQSWWEAIVARPSVIATGVAEEDLVESYRRMLAKPAS